MSLVFADWLKSLAEIFEPLEKIDSSDSLMAFLSEFGWIPSTINENDLQSFKDALGIFGNNSSDASIFKIRNLIDELNTDDETSIIPHTIVLASTIKEVLGKMVASTRPSNLMIFPFDQEYFWITFPKQ